MFLKICTFLTLLYIALNQVTFQQPLKIAESGNIRLYSSQEAATRDAQSRYDIVYTKSHAITPTPFYFLKRYKMNDRFLYENFYSYVGETSKTKWTIAYQPISTTQILILEISYIAMENLYENFFVKSYTYTIETGLHNESGSRSYTSVYNFSVQFGSQYQLSSTFENNVIAVSLTGFYHSTSSEVDIYLNSYMMNSSFFAVYMAKQVNDYWHRLNVHVCIINKRKFPNSVNLVASTIVLSVSTTTSQFTNFSSFSNVSYCLGFSGFRAPVYDKQDFYWQQFNTTTIKATLDLMTFIRFSYIVIWNDTIINNGNNTDGNSNNTDNGGNNTDNGNGTTIKNDTMIAPFANSSSPVGAIVGGIIGGIILLIIIIVGIILYRKYRSKLLGNRIQINQQLPMFMPSFN